MDPERPPQTEKHSDNGIVGSVGPLAAVRMSEAAAGEGPAPTTGPSPEQIEEQRDKEILDEWHKHPGLGPSQIVNQLARRNVHVGVHTARRVMEEAGYRPPK